MKEGWKQSKLGDLCEIGIGRTPSRSDSSLWDKRKETNNYWVSIADLGDAKNGIIVETKEYISDKAKDGISIIPKGTILLSFKLTLGKTSIAGVDLYTNEAIANLPLKDDSITKEFLLYYFQYFNWEKYAAGDEKVMGKTLNKKELDVLPVLYPSLSEQQRIVGILDAVFEKIDALKANAEKNLENAKALFQQVLAKELEPKEGWEEKKLGEVCDTSAGGTPLKTSKEYYEGGNIPWIRSGEVCKKHITESEMFITEAGLSNSSAKLFPPHTVLVAMYGATAGQVGILDFESSTNQAVCGIMPNDQYLPDYLYYYLLSYKDRLVATAVGNAQPNISQQKIKAIPLPLINIKTQQEIINTIERLDAKCRHLEEVAQKTIAECDALKQSILRQAFIGEL